MLDLWIRTLGAAFFLALPVLALDANDARRANNLGTIYFSTGRIDEAGEQFHNAYANISKEDSLTLAAILGNLGQFDVAKARMVSAERYFGQAIEMHHRLLRTASGPAEIRESETNLATAMANLGDLYRRQQRFDEAERTTRYALELKEKLYGAGALETAGIRNNLGTVQYDQKKYDDAEETLKQSLAIRESRTPPNPPATATTLSNLAAVWISKGNFPAASGALERALTMLEAHYNAFHPALVPILLKRAELYRVEGRFRAAEKTLVRALTISNSDAARDRLAEVYRAEGRITESKKVYERTFLPAPVTQP